MSTNYDIRNNNDNNSNTPTSHSRIWQKLLPFIQVCVCFCVYGIYAGYICLCMHIWRPEEDTGVSCLIIFLKVASPSEPGDRLAVRKLQGSSQLLPPASSSKLVSLMSAQPRTHMLLFWFCEGAGYPNSGPRICIACTCTHCTIFQPTVHTCDLTFQPQCWVFPAESDNTPSIHLSPAKLTIRLNFMLILITHKTLYLSHLCYTSQSKDEV